MTEKLSKAIAEMLDALKDEPALAAYNTAKDAYFTQSGLQERINEYSVQSGLLEQESKKTPRDDLLIASISARLKALYESLTAEPVMLAMQDAENDLNDILSKISNGIRFTVYGEEEEHECGGDCGHCHGCE